MTHLINLQFTGQIQMHLPVLPGQVTFFQRLKTLANVFQRYWILFLVRISVTKP